MSPIAWFSLPIYVLNQSRAPSFHSWNIPNSRINRNTIRALVVNKDILVENNLKTGNRRAISTSKIKNNTTNKKKRVEKGDRISLKGSKPHSNAVSFSLKSE